MQSTFDSPEIADSETAAKKYGESERKSNRKLNTDKDKDMEAKAQAGEIDPREPGFPQWNALIAGHFRCSGFSLGRK